MSHTTLVSAGELAARLDDPAWVVFDCRHDLARPDAGEAAWREGHIPGALFLHLDRDLAATPDGHNGRHPLPDRDAFRARLAALGVGSDSQVVAYDDAGGMFAARLWWMVRWVGHPAAAVLDGGLAAWRAAGLPLTAQVPAPRPAGTLRLGEAAPSVDTAWLLRHLDAPDLCLVDARTPERFRGQGETLDPVGGHIPGARNRFFRDNLGSDGRFRPAAELRETFLRLMGDQGPEAVVHQCGSGVTACHNILAMELAGLGGSRLYPGSWSEWCSDPARPMVLED